MFVMGLLTSSAIRAVDLKPRDWRAAREARRIPARRCIANIFCGDVDGIGETVAVVDTA